MTAVIGVFLMVVLLLALQLSTVLTRADASVPLDVDAEYLRGMLVSLQQREQAARSELDAAIEGRGPRTRGQLIGELSETMQQLDEVYARIEAVEGEIRAEFERLRGQVSGEDEWAGAIDELADAQQRVEAARAELDEVNRNARLVYIAQSNVDRDPLVIEVSDRAYRAGVVGEVQTTLRFGQGRESARRAALIDWVRQFPAGDHYVLLVCKPSGIELLDDLGDDLAQLGYAIGVDAIPEDWTALTSASTGGSR